MTSLATSLVVAIVAVGAGSAHAQGMKLVGSDAAAMLLPLGVSKSVVIDLPKDFREVLIANPTIVRAIVQTNRRVTIIGAQLGQSNVYFFDADSRHIGGLNVVVMPGPQPVEDQLVSPADVVTIFRGSTGTTLNCTRTTCVPYPSPGGASNP
jgi:Flp pilus assembly secretin CpaC